MSKFLATQFAIDNQNRIFFYWIKAYLNGANLRQGESVCAPIILKPVLFGLKSFPTVKAIIELFERMKKYFPPFSRFQLLFSCIRENPALTSLSLDSLTTWKGDTPELTNLIKS